MNLDIKNIERELNKEYRGIGKITIDEAHESEVELRSIEYIDDIMARVDPLDNPKPIIVSRGYNRDYKLIDGYHRLKKHLSENRKKKITVIVLAKFKIDRANDELLEFMEKQVGKRIRFLDNYVFELDGKPYLIKTNEGCGGCSNGWSDLEVLPDFILKTVKINKVYSTREDDFYGDKYDLYINDKLLAKVDTGWGNGYYGGDFEIIY